MQVDALFVQDCDNRKRLALSEARRVDAYDRLLDSKVDEDWDANDMAIPR